jgi:hypothetical protein
MYTNANKKFQAIQRWMCSRREITSGFLCFISFKVSPIQARTVSQFKLPLECVCVHIFLAVSLEPGRSFSFLLDRGAAEIMSSSNTYKVLRAIEKERVETTLDEGFGAGWQSSERSRIDWSWSFYPGCLLSFLISLSRC